MREDHDGVTRRRLLAAAAVGSAPAVAANAGATGTDGTEPRADDPSPRMSQEVQPEPTGLGVTDLLVVAGAAGVGGLVGGLVASYVGDDSSGPPPAGRTDAGTDHARGESAPPDPNRERSRRRDPAPPTDQGPPADDGVACPACGAVQPPDTSYCRDCGEPV